MKTSFSFFIRTAAAAGLLATAGLPVAHAQPVPNQPDNVLFNPRDTGKSPQNPPVLDDSQIVAPTSPNWAIPQNLVRRFDRFILPKPPSNTSDQTRLELEELNGLAATRSDPNVINTRHLQNSNILW